MSKTASQSDGPSSGFLRLPLELREMIYSLLLVRSAVNVPYLQFNVDSWTRSMWEEREELGLDDDMEDLFPKRKTGILSVSRQVSAEALNVLYGRNLFVVPVHGGAHSDLIRFGTANIRRIRHLRLVAQPMGFCYPETLKFDCWIWVPLLADLNQLCLVTQQPLQARGYYNAPSLEEDIREWVAWLEPVLRYLAQNIDKTTVVSVDDNDLVETSELMQNFLPAGYKKVQTVTGDRFFERGEFSWESGYWDDDDYGVNFADCGMGDYWSD